MGYDRKVSLFEKSLYVLVILTIIVGYFFIYGLIARDGGISWDSVTAIFIWVLLIIMIVLVSVNENSKEELKIIISNQIKEIQFLRDDIKRKK